MEAFTTSIRGCARCDGDGHEDVVWEPFTHPVEDTDGTLWTHWAPCPTNGEPILMKAGPKPEAAA
jgi:hypothetical protein